MAYADGSIWVANTGDGTVSRIDPRTRAMTQTTRVGPQPVAIAVTGDNIWVVNSGDGTVTQIDASNGGAVGDPIPVGNDPSAIAAGASGVWVANSGDDTIQRIDPKNGAVGKAIRVGSYPDGLAVDGRFVWVADGHDATVAKVDTESTPVKAQDLISVGAGLAAIAVTPGAVWVANQLEATVDRINPTTERRVATVPVGEGPSSIVATRSSLWVADDFDGTVTQIDPVSSRFRHKIAIGAVPAGLTLAGSDIWTATRAFAGPGHRGGTLTVLESAMSSGQVNLDANDAYVGDLAEVERAVYDGLVAFRPVAGVAGFTLVPDLAARLPIPTDGGLTYPFTLRPGIRYSDGTPVKATDFRRSLERALVLPSGNPGLYADVFGAQQCIDHPAKPCDLSEGVQADDTTGQVVFHLTAPDPYFLDDLTLFVYAVPQTAPRAKESTTPLVGTGPYKIVDYVKGKSLTLVRNPYFHQWSFAAQPDGYPDRIQWQSATSQQAITRIPRGGADAFVISPMLSVRGPDRCSKACAANTPRCCAPTRCWARIWSSSTLAFLRSTTNSPGKRSTTPPTATNWSRSKAGRSWQPRPANCSRRTPPDTGTTARSATPTRPVATPALTWSKRELSSPDPAPADSV